ncbi:hypothetical protein AAMO2058_000125600 [Amorphochlora amoebiformis]
MQHAGPSAVFLLFFAIFASKVSLSNPTPWQRPSTSRSLATHHRPPYRLPTRKFSPLASNVWGNAGSARAYTPRIPTTTSKSAINSISGNITRDFQHVFAHEEDLLAEGEGVVRSGSSPSDDAPRRSETRFPVKRSSVISARRSELIDALEGEILRLRKEGGVGKRGVPLEGKEDLETISGAISRVLHAEKLGSLERLRAAYDKGTEDITPSVKKAIRPGDISKKRLLRLLLLSPLLALWKARFRPFFSKIRRNLLPKYIPPLRGAQKSVESLTQELLRICRFEELSGKDLELANALNADYYLESLPVDLDFFNSASKVKVYRRGYSTARDRGLMLGEKLDYLQAQSLRRVLKLLSAPLLAPGRGFVWAYERYKERNFQTLAEYLDPKPPTISKTSGEPESSPESPENSQKPPEGQPRPIETAQGVSSRSKKAGSGENIRRIRRIFRVWKWELGKRLVGALERIEQWFQSDVSDRFFIATTANNGNSEHRTPRYEAVFASGPRARLFRRYLSALGLVSPLDFSLSALSPSPKDNYNLPPRPRYLSRVAIADVLAPGVFSTLFRPAVLEEPTYRQVFVLYRDSPGLSPNPAKPDGSPEEASSIHLQAFSQIPIADVKVVFPSSKLTIRPLDALKLDILSLFALIGASLSTRFADLTDIQAFIADAVRAISLAAILFRIISGYKRVYDRYQLFVSRTLKDKTLAVGFEAIRFLIDEAVEQRTKELTTVFALIAADPNGITRSKLVQVLEDFTISAFPDEDPHISSHIDEILDQLVTLGVVHKYPSQEGRMLEDDTVVYEDMYRSLESRSVIHRLKNRWGDLFETQSKDINIEGHMDALEPSEISEQFEKIPDISEESEKKSEGSSDLGTTRDSSSLVQRE